MIIKSVKVQNGRAKVGDLVIAPMNRRQYIPIQGIVAEVGQIRPGSMFIRLEGEEEYIGARWFYLCDKDGNIL